MVTIYTDGASQGNPGPGGYGVILKYKQHKKEMAEGFRKTTNNRMELLAVIKGLEALTKDNLEVTVYTDSQYVAKAFNEGWINNWIKKGFKKVKNPDLWQHLLPLYRKHNVKFKWVKGHAGHPENERCDQMAVAAAQSANLKVDKGYEESME